MALKIIMLDGLPVEVTDAGEHAINKLKGLLDASGKALTDAQATHATAIAAKDSELGKAAAEIADLKTKVLDGAALDKLVTDRAGIVAKAKALGLGDADVAGKTNAEIVRAAVVKKFGDAAATGKNDDYVGALFDHAAVSGAQADPLRAALTDNVTVGDDATAFAKARAARFAHLSDAHSQPAVTGEAA